MTPPSLALSCPPGEGHTHDSQGSGNIFRLGHTEVVRARADVALAALG